MGKSLITRLIVTGLASSALLLAIGCGGPELVKDSRKQTVCGEH